ncbi:SIR2 family protein [Microbacterium sp. NPDC056057]|uniref:P-loop NTPase n=1 Tax=Microbacterium sp. NPDC056057 TaxID=3345699 RepID=UPI0035DC285F
MTERFLSAISPELAEGVRQRWKPDTPPYARYQQAAEAVCRQRGDRALTTVIRSAVAEAIDDDFDIRTGDMRRAVRESRWKLTKAHRDLAEFYSRLPAEARSPIITTNFDPLIEVALRERNIVADAVPVSFDDPPTLAQLRNSSAVPVIHIHGYFSEPWSINSLNQLDAVRTQLEGLLSSLFVDATVLVLGYGGWEDSFMRVLQRHASDQSLLNAEVVWCAYSKDRVQVTQNPVLGRLAKSPGFQLYTGIDASTLFDAPIGLQSTSPPPSSPRGWTALPIRIDTYRPPHHFSEGATPSWSDAVPGRWPLLTATREVIEEAERIADSGVPSAGVAAIGPLGEGKSMALHQAAMAFADRSEWSVFFRSAGAPPLTREWLEDTREALGDAVFCIDEADLAADDIELLLSHAGRARSILMLAAHDRLWWSLPPSITKRVSPVLFDGLSDQDASDIAERWDDLGIEVTRSTPGGAKKLDVAAVRDELIEKSRPNHNSSRSTLFGAILAVQGTTTLSTRVDELMDRLSRVPARARSKLTLAHVYGAICLMQVATDPEQGTAQGATRSLVGEIVNIDDSLENTAVLNALGREASITFSGRHVYARHPLIAEVAVTWLRRAGLLNEVAALCGRAGARMRLAGADRLDYQDAYMLGKHLDEAPAAMAACVGAIEGAPDLLEPRITYLRVARTHDAAKAAAYARGIVPLLATASDARSAVRVYLNELARVELQDSHPRLALGVAGLVVHNGSGNPATRDQMEYGLGTMATAYRALLRQSRPSNERGAQLLTQVASLVMEPSAFRRYIEAPLSVRITDAGIARLPLPAALDRLAREISTLSLEAVGQLALPFGAGAAGRSPSRFPLNGGLDLSELRHYERGRSR